MLESRLLEMASDKVMVWYVAEKLFVLVMAVADAELFVLVVVAADIMLFVLVVVVADKELFALVVVGVWVKVAVIELELLYQKFQMFF